MRVDAISEEGRAELRRLYVLPVRVDAISEGGRAELRRLYVPNVRADAINEQGRASWVQCSISKGGCSW